MEKKMTLSELTAKVIAEMERLQYSSWALKRFHSKCRELSNFITETGKDDFFTETLGAEYLKQLYNYPPQENLIALREMPGKIIEAVRCIRRLGEYQLHGAIVYARKSNFDIDWGKKDMPVIEAYVKAAQTTDNKETTIRQRIYKVRRFYEFLSFRGIKGISEVTSQIISDYARSLHGGSPVLARHLLTTLKNYLCFLSANGFCENDLSYAVPTVKTPTNVNVPALWSKDELNSLLKCVDRGNPTGKRDYAILLLVIQLGIRVSDIADLRLDNLRWERKEIEFSQCKTNKHVIYPMLDDLGWALIDYIRYARPENGSQFVFLTCKAPYTNIQGYTANSILQRYMRQAGIKKQIGVVSGMHSLRHALGRRLLEQHTPLPIVANIMGHTTYLSTAPYLKVDINGLRECALSLEGVAIHD